MARKTDFGRSVTPAAEWYRDLAFVLRIEDGPLLRRRFADVAHQEVQESGDRDGFVNGLGDGEVGVAPEVAVAEKRDDGCEEGASVGAQGLWCG